MARICHLSHCLVCMLLDFYLSLQVLRVVRCCQVDISTSSWWGVCRMVDGRDSTRLWMFVIFDLFWSFLIFFFYFHWFWHHFFVHLVGHFSFSCFFLVFCPFALSVGHFESPVPMARAVRCALKTCSQLCQFFSAVGRRCGRWLVWRKYCSFGWLGLRLNWILHLYFKFRYLWKYCYLF